MSTWSKIDVKLFSTAGAVRPPEAALPFYRATHRQRARSASATDDLARPGALATAIELGQFRLFYQPIVTLLESIVVGHEVLIRWQHPVHGLLSAGDFLPAIDDDEVLSGTLGTWVLRQSCAAASHRDEQLQLSVNIAPRHLGAYRFADSVVRILRLTGFSPNRLVLELAPTSDPTVIAACQSLHDHGITLAAAFPTPVDGLPLGIIKIDPSITGGIGTDPTAEAAIEAAVEQATEFGLSTVAVGVETEDQARFLRAHGVTYAQGYLYGRPQPR